MPPSSTPVLFALLLATPLVACSAAGCGAHDSAPSARADAGARAELDGAVDAASDASSPLPSPGEARDAGASLGDELFTVAFPEGDPASLIWHAPTLSLYIADNTKNQVWTWSDVAGLSQFGYTSDPAGALDAGATDVGQIAVLGNNTLLVPRVGKPDDGYGALAFLPPDRSKSGLVPNLDPTRRRLGLDVAPDGRIFGSYFSHVPDAGQVGAITTVDLAAGETDYATGFGKVVGVLVANGQIYVSDQTASKIFQLPLDGGVRAAGQASTLSALARPDQLCAGPDGSIFTGQFQAAVGSSEAPAVRQIMPDGTVRPFASAPDMNRPSGVAYDAAKRRLFVANGGPTGEHFIRVFRVP